MFRTICDAIHFKYRAIIGIVHPVIRPTYLVYSTCYVPENHITIHIDLSLRYYYILLL